MEPPPDAPLGDAAETYVALTDLLHRLRLTVWSWDTEGARELLDRAEAEYGPTIREALTLQKEVTATPDEVREMKADVAEVESRSSKIDPEVKLLRNARLPKKAAPLLLLSGPARMIERIRQSLAPEEGQQVDLFSAGEGAPAIAPPEANAPPGDISYRFTARSATLFEMRGYSRSGRSTAPQDLANELGTLGRVELAERSEGPESIGIEDAAAFRVLTEEGIVAVTVTGPTIVSSSFIPVAPEPDPAGVFASVADAIGRAQRTQGS